MHFHTAPSRRSFLQILTGACAGASLLETSFLRAAAARALSAQAGQELFDLEKVADGVFFAYSRPAALTNCNAAVFERSKDLLVVDSHSKPSAAAALIAQIRNQVSPKPVRYLVNTHFHWDHVQGNSAYRKSFSPLDILASKPASQTMAAEVGKRVKAQVDEQIPRMIDQARARQGHAQTEKEKAYHGEQVRQLQAYAAEMKTFELDLPTITFDRSHVLSDPDQELNLSFHGRGHTSGDVVVFSPRRKALATGDLIHSLFPYIGDGYPTEWPSTISAVGKLGFNALLPGHGPSQSGRGRLESFRAYIEELTARVAEGKKAGKSLADLQKEITVASLKSLAASGYRDYLAANLVRYASPVAQPAPLQEPVNANIQQIYQRLG